MPKRIVIPTNCIRRVSHAPPHSPRTGTSSKPNMMLFPTTFDSSRLRGSGRRVNSTWSASEGSLRPDTQVSSSRWGYRPDHSVYASPMIAQLRESFASPPAQVPQVQVAARRFNEDDRGDPYHPAPWPYEEEYPDAKPASSSSFPPPPPETNVQPHLMGPLEHEYDEHMYTLLQGGGGPNFDGDEPLPPAPPLGEVPYEAATLPRQKLESSEEKEDSKPPAVQFPGKPRRLAGQSRGSSRANHPTSSSRQASRRTTAGRCFKKPSDREIQSCLTTRSKEALKTWYERYNELMAFKDKTGHCNVPQKYPPNPSLGIWVNKMRMEKKRYDDNGRSALTEEKIEALEAIDFAWAKQKGNKLWRQKLADLAAYKQVHGNCDVPTKYKKDTSLGRWISTQRKQYKELQQGQRSLMTTERVQALEALGFRWNASERDE